MAATDSTLDVQEAIVAAIKADATLAAIVGARVYDYVPQTTAYPYIWIAQTFGNPSVETQSGEGFEVLVYLHAVSRKPGTVEAKQIAAALVDLLNNSENTLAFGGSPPAFHLVMVTMAAPQSVSRDDVETTVIQRWAFVTDG